MSVLERLGLLDPRRQIIVGGALVAAGTIVGMAPGIPPGLVAVLGCPGVLLAVLGIATARSRQWATVLAIAFGIGTVTFGTVIAGDLVRDLTGEQVRCPIERADSRRTDDGNVTDYLVRCPAGTESFTAAQASGFAPRTGDVVMIVSPGGFPSARAEALQYGVVARIIGLTLVAGFVAVGIWGARGQVR